MVTAGAASKGMATNGVVTGGMVTNGAVTAVMVAKGMVTKGAAGKGMVTKGMATKGMVTKGTYCRCTGMAAGTRTAGRTTWTPACVASDLGVRRACLCFVWFKYIDLVSLMTHLDAQHVWQRTLCLEACCCMFGNVHFASSRAPACLATYTLPRGVLLRFVWVEDIGLVCHITSPGRPPVVPHTTLHVHILPLVSPFPLRKGSMWPTWC